MIFSKHFLSGLCSWICLVFQSQVADGYGQITVIASSDDGNDCMSVHLLIVFHQLCDDARLSSSMPLDHFHTFSKFEALSHLKSFDLDSKWLIFLSQERHITVSELRDNSFAVFELTTYDFDSVSNLNLKLRIVSDSFQQRFVIQEIPLVLVVVFEVNRRN